MPPSSSPQSSDDVDLRHDTIGGAFIPGLVSPTPPAVGRTRTWELVARVLSAQPLEFEEERKRLLFGPMLLLATAMLVTFGVYHLVTGPRIEGVVDLAAGITLASAILWLRKVRDGQPVYRAVVIMLAVLFVYFGTLSDHPYRAFWPSAFPLFALFITGAGFGMLMSALLFAAWLGLMMLPTSVTGAYDFSPDLILRFSAAYVTITMGSLFVEQVRQMYVDAMRRHREALERANLDLTVSGERFRGMAMVDPLTRVANRRAIRAHVEGEMDRATRSGDRLSVALLDIDHFKSVNDSHGHGVGDRVLRESTRRIASILRSYDRVGRYGGEEFLLVLPGAEPVSARRIVDRVREAFANQPVEVEDLRIDVTVSIGVATSGSGQDPANPHAVERLIECADRALYRAKNDGRNRVREYGD